MLCRVLVADDGERDAVQVLRKCMRTWCVCECGTVRRCAGGVCMCCVRGVWLHRAVVWPPGFPAKWESGLGERAWGEAWGPVHSYASIGRTVLPDEHQGLSLGAMYPLVRLHGALCTHWYASIGRTVLPDEHQGLSVGAMYSLVQYQVTNKNLHMS